MRGSKSAIWGVILILAAGCATTRSPQAATVRETDAQGAAGCEFLGDVYGKSGWGGAAATGVGVNNARNSALKKAARLGATHVVWGDIDGGMFTIVSGKAYRCRPAG